MKKVVDNVVEQVTPQQKKINLLSSAKEIEEKYNAMRQELMTKNYKLIYETEQHPDGDFGYKEEGGEEKYFNSLLEFVKYKMVWKGYEFMDVDAVYSALTKTISEKTYEIPAYALDVLLKNFQAMEGVGHDAVHERVYLLKPINHTFAEHKEEEKQLNELTDMYNSIQAQLQEVEQQISQEIQTEN